MSTLTAGPIRSHQHWTRPTADLVAAFQGAPSGNVSDALASPTSAMNHQIRPLSPSRSIAGPALTVWTRGGDNLAVWLALEMAQAGDVIIIATDDHTGAGAFGELFVIGAQSRGVVGIITDGMCRDAAGIRQTDVATFVAGLHPLGSEKRGPGEIGGVIHCGGVEVTPGDIVVADEDGIVVVPLERAEAVAARLVQVAAKEQRVMAELVAGRAVPAWVDERARAVGHELVE